MMGLRRKEGGMAKDIVVTLENRPGQLASVGEALGGAGVTSKGSVWSLRASTTSW
jgi:hypothetical protein